MAIIRETCTAIFPFYEVSLLLHYGTPNYNLCKDVMLQFLLSMNISHSKVKGNQIVDSIALIKASKESVFNSICSI